jgi:hypothetical protein
MPEPISTQVVLPSLRTARAHEVFREAIERGSSPSDAFYKALEALEEDTFCWGNACPECHRKVEWSSVRRAHWCPDHGFLEHGAVLLIGWNPCESTGASV